MKSYQELCEIPTFEERLEYLMEDGTVGEETFGYDRWINQRFYASPDWKRIRSQIIARDLGCDLAYPEMEIIGGPILVHHISPITRDDIVYGSAKIFDENNLVCTSLDSHNRIHYGSDRPSEIIVRTPNDTCPWKGVI